MSADIAHELNQPLNAIKMGSDFLGLMVEQKREIPPADLQQVVGEMSTQVDRATEIINTLRSFGRKAELVMERVDINKPIRAVFSLVGRQFELDNIRLELDLGRGIRPIMAHDNRLQQVFFNLVANARDAMPNGGSLRIKAERFVLDDEFVKVHGYGRHGAYARISLSDTGTGMTEETLTSIFDPFFSTKNSGEGAGLGLAISKGIIEAHGGGIGVPEDAEKGGGAIYFTLPEKQQG